MSGNNLIRLGRIADNLPKDQQQFATQKVEYLGKVADATMVFPYGMHANVAIDSLTLLFSVQGNPDNRAAIAWLPKSLPDLKPDEVAFFHPKIPNLIIKLQEDGQLLIKSAVKVFVDAPEAEFTGNVKINGNLEVVGSTTLSATVTSNGKDISDTHTHSGSPTAPTGAISDTGAVV